MTLDEFAEAVRVYCFRLTGSVTSWGRTPERNSAVGGVPGSAHLYFLGADVVYDTLPPDTARKDLARRLGLRVLIETDHDHLQPLDWSAG